MRSAAIFQIVSALASLALVTLPGAEALPVRGALGNLGARARAAKRAAAYHAQQHPIGASEPAPAVEKRSAAGKRVKNIKREVVPMEKRSYSASSNALPEEDRVVASTINPVQRVKVASSHPVKRDTIADGMVVIASEAAPIIAVANQAAAVVASSASSSSVTSATGTPSAVADAAEIYASYVAALGDTLSSVASSSTESSQAVAPTDFRVAAVQPNYSASSITSSSTAAADEQAVYESYIAAMDAPTTGLWASYTSV